MSPVGPLWSASQRRAVAVLILLVLVITSVRALLNRSHVEDPQPETPARAGDLMDRIDPNNADVATLSALPLIGPKRAADLVAFRERALERRPGRVVFGRVEDLLAVSGFGPATIRQLEPFLIFPSVTATQP